MNEEMLTQICFQTGGIKPNNIDRLILNLISVFSILLPLGARSHTFAHLVSFSPTYQDAARIFTPYIAHWASRYLGTVKLFESTAHLNTIGLQDNIKCCLTYKYVM